MRDEGALESALATVENRISYEEIDIIKCAATYAYHFTQVYAFTDGKTGLFIASIEFKDLSRLFYKQTAHYRWEFVGSVQQRETDHY